MKATRRNHYTTSRMKKDKVYCKCGRLMTAVTSQEDGKCGMCAMHEQQERREWWKKYTIGRRIADED